ncbi:MAG TPA: MDR family MFS transporter [Polyangiaceae bacterium]|mgnify:CR=1 FL=1|jgi:EmrB/QacA subfamily drug resistance transporter|nr:MAG: Multidrug resistance protein 3 [Deltaproteobacteria bacterium ADurb.Bin207]HNS99451.1 MDR family MFS transporter [Polyangiaceae bacterium]HNZ21618.1 MDR family MFS transporter [Polyangiaceae bacterium]HOD24154.1 MDR family MFS transporter [Polyangiaceae bacterium]HOE48575.1 MDR family MFS transporter [Polyangiaceae bacterium]
MQDHGKKRRRGLVLAALMATMMLAAMDTTIVSTAIPQIVSDLGGFGLFSWVFSIYLLAQTVTIPIYGKLSDLFGRKPVLIGSTVVFLIGSATSSLAWNMTSLIVFRAIQGLGAGGAMATISTLAGDLYSVRERAAVQGWLSSVWGIAAITGPLLGGALAEYVSWRWIFLINLPVGILAIALIHLFLHEKFEKGHPRIDYAGAILVLAAASTIMFGLLEGGQSWAWVSWQSLSIFALAALLVIATVWVESRASAPVMPGWLWRIPALAGSNLAGAGMGLVMMAPNSYLPTFLQSVHAMGAIGAGFVLGCMSIGWPTASALSGRLYMRIGFRDSAVIGAGLMILGSVAFLLLPKPQPIWAVALDQVILGAGFGLISTPLLVGSQSVIGWNQRGVVTGAIMFSRNLGQSLGAALFGAVFNAAIANRLQTASHSLDEPMPSNVNSVIDVLHDANTPESVRAWLRDSIGIATDHLFWGMTALSVFVLLVLFIAPRQFPVHAEEQGKN